MRPPALRPHVWLLAALLVAVGVGCIHQPMPPARQLDKKETVVGGHASWSPVYYLPRFQASLTYGLGSADIGIHGGTDFAAFLNVGVTPRLYLSRYLTLTLDADAGVSPWYLPIEKSSAGWLAGTARLTTTSSDARPVYAGLQAGLHHQYERRDGREYWADNLYTGGVIIGGDIPTGNNMSLQVELLVVPVARRQAANSNSSPTLWDNRTLLTSWPEARLPRSRTATIADTYMYSQISVGLFNYE